MKPHAFCLLLAACLLASCEDPSMPAKTSSSQHSGSNSYAKLPSNFRGSAYYHKGRYYTGGQLQKGSYAYQGRTYTTRYYHGGEYYYGGQHQNFPHENHDFQRGDFPAGNYTDGNYQGVSWNGPNGNPDH
ncbi:hypothetical protein [Prosthecobacter sp.]|uniref:hypothetical protein n=1 Tax=Prosthecobacter sp. TaxID=1965333 RepID=UPI003784F800